MYQLSRPAGPYARACHFSVSLWPTLSRPVGSRLAALTIVLALALFPGGQSAQAQSDAQQHLATASLPGPAPVEAVRLPIPIVVPWLNGMTSIHTTDGNRFVALTNFGMVIEGRLERDRNGTLAGFRPEVAHPLTFPDGRPLTNGYRAAEGLAVARDGRLFVSFEYHNRVWTYPSASGTPQDLGAHVDFGRLRNGRGLAALALSERGVLYAIPERPARMTHGFPSYRWQNGVWVGSFRMPSDGAFLPVSADFGPDGMLYVLEYDIGAGTGPQSQIRRFPVQGDAMGRGTVVLRSQPGQFAYLTGLSVWRDRAGRLRATMVADNGGIADRPGQIVEAVLPR
jgi:hypothetical protein